MMSRDSKLKIAIIAGTALLGGFIALVMGIRLPVSELTGPIAVVGFLGPCAAFYHKRQTAQFVSCLMAVMQVLVFTACFTLLMYSVATFSMPFVDGPIAECDRLLNVHVPDIVLWANNHSIISNVLLITYHTMLPQTLILVIALGFIGDQKQLESFVLRFMTALLITVSIFAIAPAKGPFAHYGMKNSPSQERYLEHLTTLRNGDRTEIVLSETEGLVTFPSFHTAWAILLMMAVWHRKRVFVPVCILNLAVIAGTLTTGWHYFTDVLGGVVIAFAVMAITRKLEPWLAARSPEKCVLAEEVPPITHS